MAFDVDNSMTFDGVGADRYCQPLEHPMRCGVHKGDGQ
jgi:hypothetical protein